MMQSFAALISPTGCYSTSAGHAYIQQTSQSYIRQEARRFETDRRSVIRSIITAPRVTKTLRAKVECFLYRALTMEQWRKVHRTGLDRVVSDYITSIKAQTTLECISRGADLAHSLEKEL